MALASDAERRLGDFKPQDLANTAWVFATLGLIDVEMFAAVAREPERCPGNFKSQGLADTAWAFAALGKADV